MAEGREWVQREVGSSWTGWSQGTRLEREWGLIDGSGVGYTGVGLGWNCVNTGAGIRRSGVGCQGDGYVVVRACGGDDGRDTCAGMWLL